MSLIDYPDVPISPGVPDVRRAVTAVATRTGILGEIQSFDQFGILSALLSKVWGVYDQDGNIAIQADTVLSFQYRGEEKVATHPVEGGTFAAYNKVTVPFTSEMIITCNNQGEVSRAQILGTLERLKLSVEACQLVTPDTTYDNANLVSYDYKRTSKDGVSMLTIMMRFQEIRDTAVATIAPTAEPSGTPPVNGGTQNTEEPTDNEESIFTATEIF